MVKKIVLKDKIYNITSARKRDDIFSRYLKYLNECVKGFPKTTIKIKKLREFDKRFEILIKGPEEIFIFNMLKKKIGSINEFKDVVVGQSYLGTMVDVGKVGFGIFVDCAILNPRTDILINLHDLRNQLCNRKATTLKEIINAFDFIDHFPLHVKIIKIDKLNNKLQGEIDNKTLDIFNKILKENIEGVFLSGETKGQLKRAIEKSGHYRDIITIERYGFLENLVLLKSGTDAPGIISNIGKNLRNCKFSALRPQRIKELYMK
ncbi:MAG: DUF2110 family protein [Promethearchaeota archaeon]